MGVTRAPGPARMQLPGTPPCLNPPSANLATSAGLRPPSADARPGTRTSSSPILAISSSYSHGRVGRIKCIRFKAKTIERSGKLLSRLWDSFIASHDLRGEPQLGGSGLEGVGLRDVVLVVKEPTERVGLALTLLAPVPDYGRSLGPSRRVRPVTRGSPGEARGSPGERRGSPGRAQLLPFFASDS